MFIQKEREIERLDDEKSQLKETVKKQKKTIAHYKIYQKFMEGVIDYSHEVHQVDPTP